MPHNHPRSRLAWLDALRGVAASVVVLGHYFWGMLHFPGQTYVDPGLFGVTVFFFISGYIVPLSVRGDRGHPAFRFAWARAFRLLPLYWVSLLIGIAVYHPGLRDSLINLTMVQRFVGVGDVINVYWTLQIELIFYAIITLTIMAGVFNRWRLVAGCAGAFAVLAVLFATARYYWNLKFPLAVPIGMAVIFTGNLKSLADAGALSPKMLRTVALGIAACLIASFYLGYSRDWGHGENPERFIVSYAAAAAVFFGVARLGRSTFRVLAGFGVISYPIYLIHQPIRDVAGQIFHGQHQVIVNLASLVMVVLLAGLLHLAIEKPGVRLGRWLLQAGPSRSVQPVFAVAPATDAD